MFDLGSGFDKARSAVQSMLGPVAGDLMTKITRAKDSLGQRLNMKEFNIWIGCLQGCMMKSINLQNLQRTHSPANSPAFSFFCPAQLFVFE